MMKEDWKLAEVAFAELKADNKGLRDDIATLTPVVDILEDENRYLRAEIKTLNNRIRHLEYFSDR